MLKIIVILAAACGAAWYYFIGGARLDEALVQQFYAEQAHATQSRDPEGLCKQLAGKLVLKHEAVMMGQTIAGTFNRDQACEDQRKTFKTFEELGAKADGVLTMDFQYNIDKLEIAPNRKSANVVVTSTLNMGNGLMVVKSVSQEQVIREWGKVLMLKGDVKSRMRANLPALADPGSHLVER